MRLLLTRPEAEPDADPFHAALLAAGHVVVSAPLLTVVRTGAQPTFDGAQGLIATSRNALKSFALPRLVLDLPLFAVGPATAELARVLGFRHVVEGPGSGRGLAEAIRREAVPGGGDLVHLAGETLAFDLAAALAPSGLQVRVVAVYRTEPVAALPEVAVEAMRDGTIDGVVLMSPRTAMVYAALIQAAALAGAATNVRHFCLSEAVAQELGPLAAVPAAVARAPNLQEMLALIAREAPDSD